MGTTINTQSQATINAIAKIYRLAKDGENSARDRDKGEPVIIMNQPTININVGS